jgi:hypothetical protein
MTTKVEMFLEKINLTDFELKWLKNKEILQYLYEDFSFLPEIKNPKNKTSTNKERKEQEDIWGRNLTGKKKDWSGPFGEEIAKEILYILSLNPIKPKKINNSQLDIETNDCIWEIKNKTYFTSGTAAEKNGNVPYKYADLIDIFNKPLKILLIAGCEKEGRERQHYIGNTASSRQKMDIQYWFDTQRQFIPITSLLEVFIFDLDINTIYGRIL